MSVTQFRNAYFPSSGSATAQPFSTKWTDTSSAQVLAGVWDARSNTADALQSFVVSYTGSPTSPPIAYCCAAQFVFPAFGVTMPFVAPPGPLGWVSFGQYPVLRAKFSQTPAAPPALGVQSLALLRVFRSDHTLRFETQLASVPIAVSAALAGRTFDDRAESSPVHQVFATDYLVVEVGFRLASFSATTFSATLYYQLGDAHSGYVVSGSVADGNAGCVIRWFSADVSASSGGARILRPLSPTLPAKAMQYPEVPNRTSDMLNELVLG